MSDQVVEILSEMNPYALYADGLESALVGYTLNHHHAHVAVYDYDLCIKILVDRDGMEPEEADEFLSFNTLGSFVGDDGPLFVQFPTAEETT
jgi:hypothetical protein